MKFMPFYIEEGIIQFGSVPSSIRWSEGQEVRFSIDPFPVFSPGGHCEQFWHWQTLSIQHFLCRPRKKKHFRPAIVNESLKLLKKILNTFPESIVKIKRKTKKKKKQKKKRRRRKERKRIATRRYVLYLLHNTRLSRHFLVELSNISSS